MHMQRKLICRPIIIISCFIKIIFESSLFDIYEEFLLVIICSLALKEY